MKPQFSYMYTAVDDKFKERNYRKIIEVSRIINLYP